jgi:hypothetical protein
MAGIATFTNEDLDHVYELRGNNHRQNNPTSRVDGARRDMTRLVFTARRDISGVCAVELP